ncbi:hypothetical protein RDABS01_037725 [Bienertia sinuspersici]
MGRLFIENVNAPKIYKCKCCKVDFASVDDVLSKNFVARSGKAYLFTRVVNIFQGPTEKRLMNSGWHDVRDIHCSSCQQLLGWKYEKAQDEYQKYKEGKYILEMRKVEEFEEEIVVV